MSYPEIALHLQQHYYGNLKYSVINNLSVLEQKRVNYSDYEVSFRCCLVGEVDRGHYTIKELSDKFGFVYKNFYKIFRRWQKCYSQKFYLSLSTMTSEELTKMS